MANTKKLIQAAAGNAGGEGLNVEDVFSTYLWNGNSVNSGDYQTIENSIALGDFGLGTSTEFAVGNTDYLVRSSDLTGNANGKTFTFSAWFYHNMSSANDLILYRVGSGIFHITIKANNKVMIGAYNGGDIIDVRTTDYDVPQKKWNHLLISMDTSVGNTTKTHIYLNDVSLTGGLTSTTVVNSDIDFTQSSHSVHRYADSLPSRGAHMYLDYTYRDLSVEANRRYFIDANGGSTSPSTLSALSPIMYLPMTEDYSIGENIGTGGDFTSNGSPTIIQSGTEYEADYGEGGLVWIKNRDTAYDHWLFDTDRGVNKYLETSDTSAESTRTKALTSFNSNGFTVGTDAALNLNGDDIASWTFRKAPKFFDVVTYTGTGSATTISHNLGSVPGCIIVKRTDSAENWKVYHRAIHPTNNGSGYIINLNLTNARAATTIWSNTEPTSTVFSVSGSSTVNASGGTYVAYLFAHNDGDGEFGPDGDADIIKCGSFTTNSDGSLDLVDLGFEPQWLMIKNSGSTGDWAIHDVMRDGTLSSRLQPNLADAEVSYSSQYLKAEATGFSAIAGWGGISKEKIYIAIRRGPMAVPESATDVFTARSHTGSGSTQEISLNHDADVILSKGTSSSNQKWLTTARLFGQNKWTDFGTDGNLTAVGWDKNKGYYASGSDESFSGTYWGSSYIHYIFKRAPEAVDFVVYTGTGSNQTIKHNLGVAPDFMLISGKNDGASYHSSQGATKSFDVNASGVITSSTVWQNTAPTATEFYVGTADDVNSNTEPFGALLLANKAGLIDVGTYTGNGTSQTIDCGFSSGARFVMLREAGTAYWYIFDTAHGIVAGDDDYFLGQTTAENHDGAADLIDPVSSGFIVNKDTGVTINTNNSPSTYIYVAIA